MARQGGKLLYQTQTVNQLIIKTKMFVKHKQKKADKIKIKGKYIFPFCCSPDTPSTPSHHDIIIHANELVQGTDGKTTGDILRNVENARDKGLLFDELLLTEASQAAGAIRRNGNMNGNGIGSTGTKACTVFVGDSMSDILPLLQVRLIRGV